MVGATYMLTQDEELWAKELPPAVEKLIQEARDPLADRSDRSGKTILLIKYCIWHGHFLFLL